MGKSRKFELAGGAATTLVLVGALVSCATMSHPADRAVVGALIDLSWSYAHPNPTEAESEAYLAIRRAILARIQPPGEPPQPTQWDAELATLDAAMAAYTAASIYAPAVTHVDIDPIEPP